MSTPNTELFQESITNLEDAEKETPVVQETQVQAETQTQVEIEDGAANPFEKRKRKRTSKVWLEFKVMTLPSGENAECIHCKHRLTVNKSGATTHLQRHLDNCLARKIEKSSKGQQNLSLAMTMAKKESISSVQNFKYDHSKMREVISHMIIVHELPFRFTKYELFNLVMQTATPHFQKITRGTAKKDCVSSFEIEKKKLMEQLKSVNRITLTTNLWKSDQNVSYMVITGHYVDSDWNLQKRTLNFCDIPTPHTRLAISDVLQKCLIEWGIDKKVWTITVDNASNNDMAVRVLKENLLFSGSLPLGGNIFHVRCCAHILNLLVQDGLSGIQDTIVKVRDSVKYITASEACVNTLTKIAKQLQLSSRKLILDCCTRWNATYFMLSAALEFKAVFPRYKQRDTSYTSLPIEDEWEKVRIVCNFLKDFKTITDLISGSEYPTSNLFLPQLIEIKLKLGTIVEGSGNNNIFMKEMITKMKTKFDKYWGSCNLLISIAAALDPRNKMKYIEHCASNFFSDVEGITFRVTVRETLNNLYAEYVEEYRVAHSVGKSSAENDVSASASGSTESTNPSNYDGYLRTVDDVDELKSDLDTYFEEKVIKWKEPGHFDVIEWWKSNCQKFRIMSRIACDVLSIPITTVASESSFSTGGRVIEPHQASLAVETVQMLLCAGDWLRASYAIKGKNKDNTDDIKEFNLS